jgi:predicted Zn-dependent protease
MPQATINGFFYHLATQLYSPERWQDKFATTHPAPPPPVQELPDHRRHTKYAQHAELEQALGNWTSARLRRSTLVVHDPQMEATLQAVAERLKTVAKELDRQVQLYILASPEINAFVVPNGDIFVTSGLLEALDSVDEVAAVIAHELDHLFAHDTTARLVKMRTARGVQMGLIIGGAVVGAGVGAVAGIAAAGGVSAIVSSTPNITADLVTNLVTNTVQMTSGVVGQAIGTTMVTGHSQDAELRADTNGAKYLWAAGYDVSAELDMLAKLQKQKIQADERQEPITSGFINARPGLDQRLEKMRPAVEQLRSLAGTK